MTRLAFSLVVVFMLALALAGATVHAACPYSSVKDVVSSVVQARASAQQYYGGGVGDADAPAYDSRCAQTGIAVQRNGTFWLTCLGSAIAATNAKITLNATTGTASLPQAATYSLVYQLYSTTSRTARNITVGPFTDRGRTVLFDPTAATFNADDLLNGVYIKNLEASSTSFFDLELRFTSAIWIPGINKYMTIAQMTKIVAGVVIAAVAACLCLCIVAIIVVALCCCGCCAAIFKSSSSGSKRDQHYQTHVINVPAAGGYGDKAPLIAQQQQQTAGGIYPQAPAPASYGYNAQYNRV